MTKAILPAMLGLALLTAACNNEQTGGTFQDQLRDQPKKKETEKPTVDKNIPARQLVGRWKPVDIRGEGVSESEKEEIYRTAELEFTEGGRFISVSSRETEHGTYRLDAENSILTMEKENGSATDFKIEWLGKSRVILLADEGSVTMQRQ